MSVHHLCLWVHFLQQTYWKAKILMWVWIQHKIVQLMEKVLRNMVIANIIQNISCLLTHFLSFSSTVLKNLWNNSVQFGVLSFFSSESTTENNLLVTYRKNLELICCPQYSPHQLPGGLLGNLSMHTLSPLIPELSISSYPFCFFCSGSFYCWFPCRYFCLCSCSFFHLHIFFNVHIQKN